MSANAVLTETWLTKVQLGSKSLSTTKAGGETEAGGRQFEVTIFEVMVWH